MSARGRYRESLGRLAVEEWDPYLTAHSALPGPRANLELLDVVGDIAPAQALRRWTTSQDEYLAACGAAGLGRLLAEGDEVAEAELRSLATDARWRVREGVAIALQRLGDVDPGRLHLLAQTWLGEDALVHRAAIAGLCEPRLLRTAEGVAAALDLLDHVTGWLHDLAPSRRRDEDVRVLRKSLGYCWSVAVAAAPETGFPRLERWAASQDPDVRWVVRENLTKARLFRADSTRTSRLAAILAAR